MLFSLAEIKIIKSNQNFKSFAIQQSESSITYKETFIILENFNQFLKKVYQKQFELPRVNLQENKNIPCDFLLMK